LRIVDLYGQLQVTGNQIVNQKGDSVALRGMSLFWSQWIGKYYNYDCVKWLREIGNVLSSAAMLLNPAATHQSATEMAKVKQSRACIDLGIYVIVGLHDLMQICIKRKP